DDERVVVNGDRQVGLRCQRVGVGGDVLDQGDPTIEQKTGQGRVDQWAGGGRRVDQDIGGEDDGAAGREGHGLGYEAAAAGGGAGGGGVGLWHCRPGGGGCRGLDV